MVQCPKCKCQVGTGIAVCPYCGNQMPIEDQKKTRTFSNTYYVPEEQHRRNLSYSYVPPYPTDPIYVPGNNWSNRIDYRDGYFSSTKDSRNTLIIVLSVLLVCMVVANICELIALLLLIG